MVWWYLLSLLLVISYCLYKYFTRTFDYWTERNVVGPKPVPLFGNVLESAMRKKIWGEVMVDIYNQFPNEKVVGVFTMTTPKLLIRDLEIVKNIMIKDFNIFADRGVEFSKEGLGVNLFHSDGSTWKGLRSKLTPIFTSGKMKNMFGLMIEAGEKFTNELEQSCNKETEHEVQRLVQRLTMSIFASCAFGLTLDSLKDKLDALKFIDENVMTVNFFQELDMMYPGILRKLNLSLFPAKVTTFFNNLVETIVSQRNGVPSNRKDFMDSLLELKNKGVMHVNSREEMEDISVEITDSIIAAQAFVFYVGGYETSATTLSYMLYLLALNPDIQDKVIAEVDNTLQKSGGKITYESVMEMSYLNQVFDETVRMYPVVDPLFRNANTDYKIPDTDIVIKKGQTVIVSATAIHNDENIYPNPKKFDPERFNAENSGNRHHCAFLPFGVGPRNCIGMRFAKIQIKISITSIFSKFYVRPSKNTQKEITFAPNKVIFHPKGGIYLNIIPRVK